MFVCFEKIFSWLDLTVRRMQEKPKLTLFFLMLFSLLLKCGAYWMDSVPSRDAVLYCLMAQEWYESGSYQGMQQKFSWCGWIPPGFLWCLKTLIALGIPVEIGGVGLNIFCGILLVPIGYGIAWEVTRNKKISLFTAVFFAVHPAINNLAIEMQRDMLFICFFGGVLWGVWGGIRRGRLYLWCISAGLAGVNFLIRYESLESIPLIFIILTVLCVKRFWPWKKALVFLLAWIVCFVVSFSFCVIGMGSKGMASAYKQRISTRISAFESAFGKMEVRR